MNISLIAIEAGDALKYDTSVNEIDRIGGAVFPFTRDEFPNNSITSARAQRIYDWLMSLGRHLCAPSERAQMAETFLLRLARDEQKRATLRQIFEDAGVDRAITNQDSLARFDARGFHTQVVQHSRTLFGQGNFFHAVFEAAKIYNRLVQTKAQSSKDGESLMLEVWSPDKGVLKITPCLSDTDRNVQDGIKFLSAGLMRAVRNPSAHEPALHWPIAEQDALDILAFVSFLFRQLDKAVKYP
jgi:uncharacterized protein (TIGR02391 family)